MVHLKFMTLVSLLRVSLLPAERSPAECQGLAMVQTKQSLEKVRVDMLARASAGTALETQAMTRKAALAVEAYLAEPQSLAKALSVGVRAVQKALPFFAASPPQISEGFNAFSSGLFDAVAMTIPDDVKSTQQFVVFREAWDETTQTLPGVMEGFEEGVKAYSEEGDVVALMRVWSTAIDEFVISVTAFLPEELGHQVAKLLAAVEEMLEGFDDGMEAFGEGNTATAIESIYSGIRSAADGLLPEEVKSNASYLAITGALDAVFLDLSSTVLAYRQNLLTSQVCWRAFVPRERTRPSQCPTNYFFDGEHWCYRVGDSAALLESAVSRKRPKGAVPSRCTETSDFNEKSGSWCYKACPYGSEPARARCKSACTGAYQIKSHLMCGRSKGTIAAAITQMTVSTLKAGFNAITAGFSAAALPGTVKEFVDAGKAFAHPKCPMLVN